MVKRTRLAKLGVLIINVIFDNYDVLINLCSFFVQALGFHKLLLLYRSCYNTNTIILNKKKAGLTAEAVLDKDFIYNVYIYTHTHIHVLLPPLQREW